MYDTRWPRPGPAMLALAVLFGLVIGGIFGLTGEGGTGGGGGNGGNGAAASGTTATPTTSGPSTFYTVVLASPRSEGQAQRKLAEMRGKGIDAFVASRDEFTPLGTPFAVCSGQFLTEAEQRAHLDEVRSIEPRAYGKKLNRVSGG
jgi:SPOR domain